MKALLWHNQRDVRVEEVPEPTSKTRNSENQS